MTESDKVKMLREALEENHPRIAAALAQAIRLDVSFVVRDSLTVALESLLATLKATAEPACSDCLGAGYVDYGERVTAPCICSVPSPAPQPTRPDRKGRLLTEGVDVPHYWRPEPSPAPRDAEREVAEPFLHYASCCECCATAREALLEFVERVWRHGNHACALPDFAALLQRKS